MASLDPGGPGLAAAEPFPWYRRMREEQPISADPRRGWMVFRYRDVQPVLSDHQSFSSEFGDLGLLNTDPPRHRQLRSLVSQTFTPRTVEQLAGQIEQITAGLLERLPPEPDLIRDLAVPLPITVIAGLLGIPAQDRERFKRWSDAVVTGGGAGMPVRQAREEMQAYFGQLLDRRRSRPGSDLISALVQARVDGESLTRSELISFCVLLLIAGNETTTNLIGNAVLCLDEHPQAAAELRQRPDLLEGAIEEVLRYRSPIQAMFRIARPGATLDGQELPAGAPVLAWIGSANRDPEQFPDPDRFDIHRQPNHHLAFGQGIHFCLGAPLARLEARIALRALLQRPLVVDRERLERFQSHIVYGVRTLPLRAA